MLEYEARKRAVEIINSVYEQETSREENGRIIALTRYVFENFEHDSSILLPLRGYLTNHRLPEFLRLEKGVLEVYTRRGSCDNAARMLSFILKQENIESTQWDMSTNTGAHSAVLATLSDGGKALLDPYYGYITTDRNGRVIHPHKAQEIVLSGKDTIENVFVTLSTQSANKSFYNGLESMVMGTKDQELVLWATLPNLEDQPLILGKIDGKHQDVKKASKQKKIRTYWYYMGHKYRRNFTRVMKFNERTKVTMILVAKPEEGILIANRRPSIEGKKLTWYFDAGEELRLRDGLAKISWKRLNSFVYVDQIIFERAS